MNNPESILDNSMFVESKINTVNIFTGCDMTINTSYFSPKQVREYKTANPFDICIFFFKGNGKCYLKNNSESIINVTDGSIVYIPQGVSYKIENADNPMIVAESVSSTVHH